MNEREMKKAASDFSERWKGRGDEKQHTQLFWKELLQDVYEMPVNCDTVEFEKPVTWDNTTYIDVYIPETKVLIEQKSIWINLDKEELRHDEMLTPFDQAKQYSDRLPTNETANYIITCNFEIFRIYDLNKNNPHRNYIEIKLSELAEKIHVLDFLVNKNKGADIAAEDIISRRAGELVGLLKNALLKQYKYPESEESQRSLCILCVRFVFCMYAEDSGVFPKHLQFHDYLAKYAALSPGDVRSKLIELFRILDTPESKRDPYLDNDLKNFPYVNGGLFEKEDIEIPHFTDEIVDILLRKASAGFDWSQINPTIFGAMFESVLNDEERSSGGMHYTDPANIHKVIDPLFLDNLKAEFEKIMSYQRLTEKINRLNEFQKKLASLRFLDPACGSGNFLTLAFCELRRLENKVIAELYGEGQLHIEGISPVMVSISQFYGIEIHEFAASVARTALWIAESQMLRETEVILNRSLDFLPLKSYPNIRCENALRIDWNDVVPKEKLSYIMGNPPFVGVNYMTVTQRNDMDNIWKNVKRGKLDYVTCWYLKASDFMLNTQIRTALVSTNSVSQGEQASVLWKELFSKGIHIDFAHRTFIWDSEATVKAHVHCVIIGFSFAPYVNKKYIYSLTDTFEAKSINGYLLDAPSIVIEERSKPLCDVPAIVRGSQATDDGYYLFTPEEKEKFIKREPKSEKYFKRFMMGREFINNIERWCLWIPDITPNELKNCPEILKRVQAVKKLRIESKNKQTQQAANVPWRFGQYRPPAKRFIAFAKVSSERRMYIPFGFLTDDIIPGDKLFTIPDANLYMFGILTSNVHMAWMRTVCGRLKSDYSYSTTIVYNNFPWCSPTEKQKAEIEKTARMILDAREKYPDSSLADLYDENTMPAELRKAHKANDKAVMKAYGFSPKMSESEIVAELMKMYRKLADESLS